VPASYSLQLIPESTQVATKRLTPGQHSYITLRKGEQECLNGTFTSNQEQVLVSVDAGRRAALEGLETEIKIGGKAITEFEKEEVGNLIAFKLKG
jgi:hypothetical protein